MRFVLIGKAGSGKDTAADYLIGAYGFIKKAFADALKAEAAKHNPDRYKEDRRAYLQEYGEKMRNLHGEDYWVHRLFNTFAYDEPFIVITDCRYPNEYSRCVDEGFIPVKINCDDMTRQGRLFMRDGKQMSIAELSHVSEQLNVPCDYHLDNNYEFMVLYTQVDKMVKKEMQR
jgi:dephospho-CoA kinase